MKKENYALEIRWLMWVYPAFLEEVVKEEIFLLGTPHSDPQQTSYWGKKEDEQNEGDGERGGGGVKRG